MSERVIHGDCLDVLPTLSGVDAIVCDPPYGLGFMGKQWDHGVPGVPFWTAALNAAKPGAYLVAFGGTRTYHRLTCAIEDAGWEIRDCLSWLYGSGFPKSHNGAWGGTALKPAWEPIILARKPLAGTVEANHATHGTGALNIDGCRIACEPGDIGNRIDDPAKPSRRPVNHMNDDGSFAKARAYTEPEGRWPANVVLDEEAAAMLDEQAPATGAFAPVRGTEPSRPAKNTYGEYARGGGAFHHDGIGGASRFFYCAKASKDERDSGLAGFQAVRRSDGRSKDIENAYQRTNQRTNHHPTVKPLDLMRWLCKLVTPAGGTILDPFTGSGTTGCAAVREGFSFIGIEREAEYVAIANARIAHHATLYQPTLFNLGGAA